MTIDNIADGVRLVSERTDKFKTAHMTFSMLTPLDGNLAAKAILPFLLHRRCAAYPQMTAFNGMLDELYGASLTASVAKKGEGLLLSIDLTTIDDRFALEGEHVMEACARLMVSLVFDPVIENESFPADIVAEEKRLLLEKLAAEQNDKRRYALLRCEEVMFAHEAYGRHRYGTAEQIRALTPKDVYAAWRHLLKTAVMQLTVAGSGETQLLSSILKEKIAGIAREPESVETEFVTGVPKPNYVSETQPVKQGKLVMGFRTGMRHKDDNAYAMRLAVEIFGGGTYSKLFSFGREKMSLGD